MIFERMFPPEYDRFTPDLNPERSLRVWQTIAGIAGIRSQMVANIGVMVHQNLSTTDAHDAYCGLNHNDQG